MTQHANRGATLTTNEAWATDGHLEDVAIVALADGQEEILPDGCGEHAMGCEACAHRVGEAALLAAQVGDALGRAEPVAARARMPRALVAVALLVAVLGALPSLPDVSGRAILFFTALPRVAPMVIESSLTLGRAVRDGPLGIVVSASVFVLLSLVGFLVARASRRPISAGAPQ